MVLARTTILLLLSEKLTPGRRFPVAATRGGQIAITFGVELGSGGLDLVENFGFLSQSDDFFSSDLSRMTDARNGLFVLVGMCHRCATSGEGFKDGVSDGNYVIKF